MPAGHTMHALDHASLDDGALVVLVQRGDREAFRHIIGRCNQRLFRMARAVVGDDAEAQDVVQEAYLHAFEKIATFRGEASVSTWLTRVVLNGAYSRLRQRRHTVDLDLIEAAQTEGDRVVPFPSRFGDEDPAATLARTQIRTLVEHAIDALPEAFRVVFVMRDVEGCSIDETAAALELRPETVKTRLHRARRLLRAGLSDSLSSTLSDAFPFRGSRCEQMTAAVMQQIDANRTTRGR